MSMALQIVVVVFAWLTCAFSLFHYSNFSEDGFYLICGIVWGALAVLQSLNLWLDARKEPDE